MKRPRKRIRPGPQNRDTAVGLIREGIRQTDGFFATSHAQTESELQTYLAEKACGPVSVSTRFYFFYRMGLACNAILREDPQGWNVVRECFSVAYWGQEIGRHHRRAQQIGFDRPLSFGSELVKFHFLALAGQADGIADWVGRFAHNLVELHGLDPDVQDETYLEFYWGLLNAQFNLEWPDLEKLGNLGGFGELLECAAKPEQFRGALERYADFRLARAYQYENVEAPRPRKPSDPMFEFEAQWFALWPLELLAMNVLAERCFGKPLPLDAGHPLLDTPLLRIPAMLPLVETDVTAALRKMGEEAFGDAWRPLSGIEHPHEP